MDWQQIAALALVLSASIWLSWKLWRARRTSCGCGENCASKSFKKPV